jgi:hypothetical protein
VCPRLGSEPKVWPSAWQLQVKANARIALPFTPTAGVCMNKSGSQAISQSVSQSVRQPGSESMNQAKLPRCGYGEFEQQPCGSDMAGRPVGSCMMKKRERAKTGANGQGWRRRWEQALYDVGTCRYTMGAATWLGIAGANNKNNNNNGTWQVHAGIVNKHPREASSSGNPRRVSTRP